MTAPLADQIRARLDDPLDVVLSPQPYAAAVRAVLELHAPEVHEYRAPTCKTCIEAEDFVDYPCGHVRIIAAALGIDTSSAEAEVPR